MTTTPTTPSHRYSYALLRPARFESEDEPDRVLMIVDSRDEAEAVASELLSRGVAAEIRTAVGSGPRVRLSQR